MSCDATKGETVKTRALVAVIGMMCGVIALAAAPAGSQGPPTCNGRTATIWGDDGNNRIFGTDGPDVIHGLGGRDRIFGGGGADIICGGEGADLIKGQKGKDTIFGDNGRDRLVGGQGADIIDGGRGNDSVRGGFGDDQLIAGPGDDLVQGGGGLDECEFDRNDTFELCEGGDVRGFTSFGDATVPVAVPADFAFSTYDVNGVERKAYLLEIFVLTSNGVQRTYNVDVLDRFGNVIGGDTRTTNSSVYDTLVVANNEAPATLQVTGLGPDDFWDVAFVRPQTAQQIEPVTSFNGFDSWAWKLRGGVPAGHTVTLTYGPTDGGDTVSGLLIGYSPAGTPTLLFEMNNVTEETVFSAPAPAGETFYFIYGPNSTWNVSITPAG